MKLKLLIILVFFTLLFLNTGNKAFAQGNCQPVDEACASSLDCCPGLSCVSGFCKSSGTGNTPNAVSKVSTNIASQVDKQNYFQSNLGTFISKGLRAGLIIAAILCLIFIIWGAIEWILSGGDKNKYESARNKITTAIVGLIIAACAWLLWTLIINMLGINRTSLLNIGGTGNGNNTNLQCNANISNCSPYADCQTWVKAFSANHGRCPTETDIADFRASQEFLAKCGRNPTQDDWNYRYTHNNTWPNCN